ncbi:MAG: hypothetical protein ACLUJG_16145 [Lawsonibacter sp.]
MDYCQRRLIFQGFLPKIHGTRSCPAGGGMTAPPRKMLARRWGPSALPCTWGGWSSSLDRERQHDADVLLTPWSPDARSGGFSRAFAERLRQEGRSVRCERETGQPCPVRCRKKVRYTESGSARRRCWHDQRGAAQGAAGRRPYETLAAAGYDCPAILEKNRKLTFENLEKGVRYFWVKPSDVSIYVERGAADVGIAGRDILLERRQPMCMSCWTTAGAMLDVRGRSGGLL